MTYCTKTCGSSSWAPWWGTALRAGVTTTPGPASRSGGCSPGPGSPRGCSAHRTSRPSSSTGIGLADLIKIEAESQGRQLAFGVRDLLARLSDHRPRRVAFNGKVAATPCARSAGYPPPGLGLQDWTFAGAPVFVLPSSSGANRRRDYDGRPDRASWWNDCGALVRQDDEPAQAT